MPAPTETATPTQSPTPGQLKISSVYFDSPGTDDGSAASVNGEWVAITNGTATTADMTNWTLQDASSHTYVFPSFTLAPNATVEVHAGSGSNTASDLYWGSGTYVWNNTGDTATLRDASATLIGSCTYSQTQDPQAMC